MGVRGEGGTHCKEEVEEEESVLHTLNAGLHGGLRLLTGWLAGRPFLQS